MKIMVTGKLGNPAKRGLTTIAVLESRESPILPPELPPVPQRGVTMTLFIGPRHWRIVEPAPSVEYTVTGQCFYDAELQRIAVMVTGLKRRSEARRR